MVTGTPVAAQDPTCADTLNIPTDPGQVAAIQRILNENTFSWMGQKTCNPGDTYGHPTGPNYDYEIYNAALISDPDSAACAKLRMAIDALNAALANPFSDVYWWKGVIQGPKAHRFLRKFRPGKDIRIGFTDFTIGLSQ